MNLIILILIKTTYPKASPNINPTDDIPLGNKLSKSYRMDRNGIFEIEEGSTFKRLKRTKTK